MNLNNIQSIDQVIDTLDKIINDSITTNDPLGYFAALYQAVTIRVKQEIANNYFEDGSRMERLDVVFARRYISAYQAYRDQQAVTRSWEQAFAFSTDRWPIVLQHLLLGMNAHINLDLGIAAAEISKGHNPDDLKDDFNKINEILSSLVHEVENDLSVVWPALKFILKWTGKVDDFLVDFSMKLARDGAWKFSKSMANRAPEELKTMIETRDQKVANKIHIIMQPGLLATVVLRIIRLTERGTIAEKIGKLRNKQ
ncbi:MAG TPA: DUF5995 family protein [Sunxiuqinia sp.]|nr:DUF5995 family protein [Sunxiuqinia sp.]